MAALHLARQRLTSHGGGADVIVLSLRAGAKRQHYHISATAMRGEALPGKMKCSHLRLPLIGLADADLPGGRAQYFLSPGR